MLVNSPLAMSNLGTRSIFQSFTRPYFFHGSPAVLPYFLKSWGVVSVDLYSGWVAGHTASMLTDAASLSSKCQSIIGEEKGRGLFGTAQGDVPSVVVVAVNVEDLLAFYTEHTAIPSVTLTVSSVNSGWMHTQKARIR